MTNITTTQMDLERYADGADLSRFVESHGLDGLEVLPYMGDDLGIIPPDLIAGLHMTYFPGWIDFWHGDEDALKAEFVDLETAYAHYGGRDRSVLIGKYAAQMELAHKIGAQYVVFHVSDVSLAETVSYRFIHSDEQVIDATCELLNQLTKNKPYTFELLLENLWWPGLTMTNPDMTRRLLDGVAYDKTGIMLDTGHLLHTNIDIETQDEGVDYIHRCLDAHGDLMERIRGVHLHQSTSGDYVKRMIQDEIALGGSYYDRLGQVYGHVFSIDTHRPFTAKGVKALIDRIAPEYLTHEFITTDRDQHETFLREQIEAIRKGH